jgi:hypothetical protein
MLFYRHHGIGEILFFVIKVSCLVPEFIDTVFAKKALFRENWV